MPEGCHDGVPAPVDELAGDARVPTGVLAAAAAAVPAAPTGLVTLTASERQIPAPVLAAYQQATTTLTAEQPGCHLR